jgi:hypothetical protein
MQVVLVSNQNSVELIHAILEFFNRCESILANDQSNISRIFLFSSSSMFEIE